MNVLSPDVESRMQAGRQNLLSLLADGAFHSGADLAERLRASREDIWKWIRSLRALGVEIESTPRRGYRLPCLVDWLDKDEILAATSSATRASLQRLDVLPTVDSTNRYLAENIAISAGGLQACLAEIQYAGRGRRGRHWIAPFGSGICLSLGWRFLEAPPTFSALSLAVGVAVVQALRRCGALEVGLKWPNDLIWQQRKLGGILVEMRVEPPGSAHVVIGIGINVAMPAHVRLALAAQQAASICDVREMLGERTPARSVLAGWLIDEVAMMLKVFSERGFAPFIDDWRRLDTLANAPVKVLHGAQTIVGTARGADADGSLLVEVDGAIRRFVSGEVSLRRCEAMDLP